MSSNWHRVTAGDPCPICDGTRWCSISIDGQRRICRRVNNGTGKEYQDKNGAYFWLYRTDGELLERPQPYETPIAQTPTRADAPALHVIYTALLSHLTLSQSHRENLLARGLTPHEITHRRYATLPVPRSRPGRTFLAKQLVEQFGADLCVQVPGLYMLAIDSTPRWSLAGAPGMVIPVRNLDGRIVALKIRADVPQPDAASRYTYLSSNKHHGPGSGSHAHVPLRECDHHTIRITEGELKADIATAISGILTISVPGVSNWRVVAPILQALNPTTVLLAFDADWRTNPAVASALRDAIRGLQQTPCCLEIEYWDPKHGKGIDDVLAQNSPTHLMSPTRALRALGRPTTSPIPRARQSLTINPSEVSAWRRM